MSPTVTHLPGELDGMPEPVELVPRIDGERVDKIEIVFTGRLPLDATDQEDADLYKALTMGKTVNLTFTMDGHTLELEGTVAGTPHAMTFDAEGWAKNLTGRRRIKIHSGDRPAQQNAD